MGRDLGKFGLRLQPRVAKVGPGTPRPCRSGLQQGSGDVFGQTFLMLVDVCFHCGYIRA